jgi:cytochrome c oxidase cbb3-type subunit 3/ubiquinol-cytochrome c reductase cytochrome c subunit
MTSPARLFAALAFSAGLVVCSACNDAPGYPKPSAEIPRPDQQLDFHALYKSNCSGCHGQNGRGGAAIPLNNPAFLAVAGADNLRSAAAKGVSGTLMPAFAASAGGMLTDPQIDAIVQGMIREWAQPASFSSVALPPYAATTPGNPAAGQTAYIAACARCHGNDGTGIKAPTAATANGAATPHSIVDVSYLALVSDQSLRSLVIAGHLDDNAPDWRSYIAGRALTPQEITDIVAWLAQHRAPATAQSIATSHTTPPATTAASAAKEKP